VRPLSLPLHDLFDTTEFTVNLQSAFPIGAGGLGVPTPALVTTVTAAGIWQIQSAGMSQLVVMMTAYTSGSAVVSVCPSCGG